MEKNALVWKMISDIIYKHIVNYKMDFHRKIITLRQL